MSVSARSYMSASLAVLTAGVVALAPVTPDVATPQSLTADVTLAAVSGFTNFTKPILVPPYTLTQAAYLTSDAVAVAASGVAVAATYTTAALLDGALYRVNFNDGETDGQELPPAFQLPPPSVTASVARFNPDLPRLTTDWANTFNPAHFNVYVAGLAAPESTVPTLLPPPPPPVLASRARAASVTPRQAPSAKAAAASAQAAPTAEQGQRREARGAAHRADRSGVSATP